MALKAGYVGVKRWLYEKLQATTAKNVQDIANIWAVNGITGSKNLLPTTSSTTTIKGVTFTVNKDLFGNVVSVKANGTNDGTGNSDFPLIAGVSSRVSPETLGYEIGKEYIMTGCTGGSSSTYILMFNGSAANRFRCTDGPVKDKFVEGDLVFPCIRVAEGRTVNNVMFYPMLRLATDPDATYAPYAMTNQQLTKSVVKTTGTFDQVTANKSGYMVELSFTGTTITNEDGKTLGTLDAAYRPGANINLYTKVYNGSSYVDAQVKVTALTGAVELLTLQGSAVTGAQVNFLLARPVFMSGSAAGLTRSVSDTREASPEVIEDEPELVTKTTRSTKKTANN